MRINVETFSIVSFAYIVQVSAEEATNVMRECGQPVEE